jgi:hypothetical protein
MVKGKNDDYEQILIEEVEELKNLLSQGKAEIPSFWECFGLA